MIIDKSEFKVFRELAIFSHSFRFGGENEKYIRAKGDLLISLINELNKKNLLKELSKADVDTIKSEYATALDNLDYITQLSKVGMDLADNSKAPGYSKKIVVTDQEGVQYNINMGQIVILIGFSYCALCELMKTWLTKIIDFKKVADGKPPSGLRSLINKLKQSKLDTHFFDDIDTDLRNAFSHLDFRLHKGKVCYKKGQGRKKRKVCIGIDELFQLRRCVDLSSYVAMSVCTYVLSKSQGLSFPQFQVFMCEE